MRFIAFVAAVIVMGAAPALAAPEDVANEVSAEVMSPFCDGVTLHDCPSQAALDLRDQIQTWAEDGWSKSRIIDELEDRFGPGIHATPQDSEGVGAWALPVGALLAGIALLAWLAPRWTKRRRDEEPPPVDAADHARIERELAALREEMP
jgi:cytochrome c-type biogenesis protein CcmH/NrfF